jgi:hypothetical protein
MNPAYLEMTTERTAHEFQFILQLDTTIPPPTDLTSIDGGARNEILHKTT